MINNLIQINNLSKAFGNTQALNNINLVIESNKIYGLLGRNGAGKTTLINTITNKLFPDQGNVMISGKQAAENDLALSKIFCMSENNCYPYDIKVKNVYKWLKCFYPSMDIDYTFELADKFSLDTNKVMKTLSTGYDTIARLIPVLATDLPISIFDEPILGLDANHRDLFYRELIKSYDSYPRTIIVSTHLIDEVADILNEVIIINKGEIVISKSTEEFLESGYMISGKIDKVQEYSSGKKVIYTQTIGNLQTVTLLGLRDDNDNKMIKKLNLDISQARLQELFIYLTNS